MIMGLATMTPEGASAVLFYLVAYMFMNLGAFGIIAFLRNATGSEDLRDFRGLVQRSPVLVISLAVCMLSLLGMPPLVGFAAKFQIFQVLYDSSLTYTERGMPGLASLMIGLLVIAGVNSVISLVYYVKVMKVMIIEKPLEEVEGQPAKPLPVRFGALVFSAVMAFAVLGLGILWDPLSEESNKGTIAFHSFHDPDRPAQGSGTQLAEEEPR
jgi:NADH-quinone oxidoreductase subunit N